MLGCYSFQYSFFHFRFHAVLWKAKDPIFCKRNRSLTILKHHTYIFILYPSTYSLTFEKQYPCSSNKSITRMKSRCNRAVSFQYIRTGEVRPAVPSGRVNDKIQNWKIVKIVLFRTDEVVEQNCRHQNFEFCLVNDVHVCSAVKIQNMMKITRWFSATTSDFRSI